ncbi:TolB family protein [Georgenia deserti]|uniref:TolB family protein n=1 Tax=Georgenia deserti TaxID=2093781 RepID=A0ABW4L2Y1_9MICO
MTDRLRGYIVIAVVVVVTAGVVAFGLNAYADHVAARENAPAVARTDLATVEAGPRVVFRSTAPGADYGKVAMVPLSAPDGPRAVTDITCDRVDVGGSSVSCLRTERGVVTTFEAELYDEAWNEIDSWPLAGIPNRTRLSEDGALIATTAFVTGHSYASTGFSTQTEIHSAVGADYGNIEDFALLVDGAEYTAADRNMWGVTFVDDEIFYATAASASAGTTWLVRGDLAARTLTAIRENVECPSISPDGTRLAYKKDRGDREWDLAVLDLASGDELVLGETRSVDDQVEWLDDDTVLYGMTREADPGVSDVWSLDIDENASPELFLPQAWSPSVVRP